MSRHQYPRLFWAALACGLAGGATNVLAHHPGSAAGGGAGPIITISATTLEAGQSAVSFTFESIQMQPLSDFTLLSAAEAHQHVHSVDSINSYSLGYSYGVTNDLTLSLRLPWVVRNGIREGHHEHHDEEVHNEVHDLGDTAGIGDMSVLGQYRFYNNRAAGLELALLAGVKAPTGKTSEMTDAGDERFATEFQPGSGSWDGMIGLAMTRRAGPWSFDANVMYTLAGDGAQDTNLGDRFHYNAAVSYRILGSTVSLKDEAPHSHHHGGHKHSHDLPASASPAVDLVLELNGEWNAKTEEGGEKDPNSGGNTVYLSPGVRVTSGDWSGFVSAGVPIVNDLNGIQAEPDWRVVSGFSFSLR